MEGHVRVAMVNINVVKVESRLFKSRLLFAAAILPSKSVHAELVIGVPPAVVWNALMDSSGYGDWNPIFTRVDGVFAEGAIMALSMTTSDGGSTDIEVVVKEMIPNQKLHQSAGIPGVLTANHQWLVEEIPEGTRVTQHEEYRGVGVLFYDPAYVQDFYQQGMENLKKRLERDSR